MVYSIHVCNFVKIFRYSQRAGEIRNAYGTLAQESLRGKLTRYWYDANFRIIGFNDLVLVEDIQLFFSNTIVIT
jgi:hypothetical protein